MQRLHSWWSVVYTSLVNEAGMVVDRVAGMVVGKVVDKDMIGNGA